MTTQERIDTLKIARAQIWDKIEIVHDVETILRDTEMLSTEDYFWMRNSRHNFQRMADLFTKAIEVLEHLPPLPERRINVQPL